MFQPQLEKSFLGAELLSLHLEAKEKREEKLGSCCPHPGQTSLQATLSRGPAPFLLLHLVPVSTEGKRCWVSLTGRAGDSDGASCVYIAIAMRKLLLLSGIISLQCSGAVCRDGPAAPQGSILPQDTLTWLRSPRLNPGDDPSRNSAKYEMPVAIILRNSWDRVGRGQARLLSTLQVHCDLKEVMTLLFSVDSTLSFPSAQPVSPPVCP